jgi:hypothetical protein
VELAERFLYLFMGVPNKESFSGGAAAQKLSLLYPTGNDVYESQKWTVRCYSLANTNARQELSFSR